MSAEGHFCDNCWCDSEHGCVCGMCDSPVEARVMSRTERALSVAKSFSPHLWNGRHEAALLKLGHLFTPEQAAEAAEKKRAERLSEVGEIVAASDALLRTPAAVERVDIAISAHEVITDGLTEPSGWCPVCGNIDDVSRDRHQARAVIAALFEDGEA